MTVSTATQTRPQALTFDEVQSLVAIEYDFVHLDVDVSDLIDRIVAAPVLPGKNRAAVQLAKIRAKLLRVLRSIDGPISDAVAQHERDFPPPW